MARSRTWMTAILAIASTWPVARETRADRIKLRGGGEITGVILKDPSQPKTVLVQTKSSAKPLSFAKDQVLGVTREPSPLDEYVANREKIEATAQAQYDFGLWCEEQKLTGPAEVHFQKSVALDPQFGPAHKKLGHVQLGSRWLTYDEQREAQGLVKYKGKWISRAEKEKLDAKAALSAEQSSWAARLKLLRAKLYDGDPAIREQAEAQIAAIRDPAAIPGLIRAFAFDGNAVRIRLAQLLGAIEGPEATEALVNLVLAEAEADVRQPMMDELVRRRDKETAGRFVAALKLNNPDVVGRAAWALAAMKAVAAVPKMVDALYQTEKRIEMVQVPTPSGSLSGGYSFGGMVSGGPSIPAGAAPGFGVVASQPIITGVAVAPGVVAYGASSVPVPVGVNPMVNSGQIPTREIPTRVTVHHANAEVLKALQSLTNVNLGFDQAAWKRWVSTSFHPEPDAPRRVPQP